MLILKVLFFEPQENGLPKTKIMKKLLLILFCLPFIGFGQNLPSGIVMINIPGGTFTMGNNSAPQMFDDQDPEHLVTIEISK